MNTNDIKSVAIYPPIGIARIGNSQEYFFAPDIPGVEITPEGGYKDGDGRVKKQVARFRIYALGENDTVLGEITETESQNIHWRIQVANVKAAWYMFNNALDVPGAGIPSAYRNADITDDDRAQLAITPTPVSISGRSEKGKEYNFDDGEFFGKKVKLGHVETDEEGRLLFFGGDGDSASKKNKPAITFANNEGWHDDTCDGVVRATVIIGGKEFEAEPANVAVTPPNFGPGLYGVVTMNDVVQDLFIREMNYPDPAADGVVFYEHIYPMLERMTDTQWVNQGFFMLFGKNSPSDFTDPVLKEKLESPSEDHKALRERIFEWFRDPESKDYTPAKVPPFYGDGFGEYEKIAIVDLPITQIQYARLKKWANGDFTTGHPKEYIPFGKLSPAAQVNALNQAPMEECLGGPFHPGIELTWPMRVKQMWKKPYRLNVVAEGEATDLDFGPLLSPSIVLGEVSLGKDGPLAKSGPGALTRWLGVPWQTDEASCLSGYDLTLYLPLPSFWAARVPNQVLSEDSYKRSIEAENLNIAQRLKHFDYRQDWLRDLGSVYQTKINHMISEWHELGIIAKTESEVANADGFLPNVVWKETERKFGEHDPTFDQVVTAETITEEKDTVLLKVATIEGEKEVKAKAASHSETSTRKRRRVSRGER
ncbi:L-lysine 6-oxidase [Kordia sp. SMS9]|uniref:LodA/GoxA family CTQ-dependent oxidase n=1 Tax=Kordia sp. SMS9 TaxID=2282170 RepID=UPI000E0DA1BD|nr:LodA/GoxA family CTQ-dependent oxidase [Kordia sp. SMS9]AXG71646.1 L-lysine 6-oxidase [Kordia sp. SMS9]